MIFVDLNTTRYLIADQHYNELLINKIIALLM